jgi:hypothetical protein
LLSSRISGDTQRSMTTPAAANPRKASWRRVIALLLFLGIPLTPQFRILFPIEQTALLLAAIVASCMVVGWRQGGKLSLAVIWVALSVALMAWPTLPPGNRFSFTEMVARGWNFTAGTGYPLLARGWIMLLAASFGLVSLFGPSRGFIARALSTLAIATGVGFVLVLLSPGGPTRIAGTVTAEYTRRNDESIAQLRAADADALRSGKAEAAQPAMRVNQWAEAEIAEIFSWSSLIVPAALAIESLAALALAWALYHRLNAVAIGPPLSRLREFRFNDQLVWGVAVGASVFLLPAFAEAKNAGLNILIFFGSLYVLRGLGILGWISNGNMIRLVVGLAFWTILVISIAYKLGFLLALGAPLIALAFSLGLGDTWVDWRSRLQPKAI